MQIAKAPRKGRFCYNELITLLAFQRNNLSLVPFLTRVPPLYSKGYFANIE